MKTTALRAQYFTLLSAHMAEHLGLMNRMNDDIVVLEGKDVRMDIVQEAKVKV